LVNIVDFRLGTREAEYWSVSESNAYSMFRVFS